MHAFRYVMPALTALVGFIAGWYLTLLVLMWAMKPGAGCASPCDGPAYAATALSLVLGPVIGVLAGGVGALLAARLFRRGAPCA
jgi:hypothetical protein